MAGLQPGVHGQQKSLQTEALAERGLFLVLCQDQACKPQRLLLDRVRDGKDASIQEMSILCPCVCVSSFELVLAILPHCHFVVTINFIFRK